MEKAQPPPGAQIQGKQASAHWGLQEVPASKSGDWAGRPPGSRGRAPTISSGSSLWSEKTLMAGAPGISWSSPVAICGRSHDSAWHVCLWATGVECLSVNI